MDRKLALQRVLALAAGPLARYLAPLLSRDAPSLTRDAYLRTVLSSLSDDPARSVAIRVAAADLGSVLMLHGADAGDPDLDARIVRRAVVLREVLNRHGGIQESQELVAHSTAVAPAVSAMSADPDSAVLPVVIWIPHLRSPFNVGNIIRTAAGFGVAGVVLGRTAPEVSHPRLQRAAMGATEMIPIIRGGREEAAQLLRVAQTPLIALETGGSEISRFPFPPAGIMVVGHEELGVPEEVLQECHRNRRVVTISHGGPKSSLNVGVAAGICLSWWRAQRATD